MASTPVVQPHRGRKRLLLLAGVAGLSLGQASLAAPPGQAVSADAAPVAASAQAAAPTPSENSASRDIAGQWQGTLHTKRTLRLVFIFAQTEQGWSARLYSIDQSGQPFTASSVTLDGPSFKCSIDVIGATYPGTLSSDGSSIVGTWTQGSTPQPLTLVRVAGKAAWKIPAPPKPAKRMDGDADVSFRRATIKVSGSSEADPHMYHYDGRSFTTRNTSVSDLISYAYEVQGKQIAGLPDWIDDDRYDIAATLDLKGEPSHQQLRVVVKKLLAQRFQLLYHPDKSYMPAYVMTVGKAGHKLAPTQFQGQLPGMGMRPEPDGLAVSVSNATLEDFTVYLQLIILDRPVVDLTGLTGRFDFQFTYTPDAAEFGGHPPRLPPATVATQPAPNLFAAIQQKLGLELTGQDTLVDVIAVDHVEKPSLK